MCPSSSPETQTYQDPDSWILARATSRKGRTTAVGTGFQKDYSGTTYTFFFFDLGFFIRGGWYAPIARDADLSVSVLACAGYRLGGCGRLDPHQ